MKANQRHGDDGFPSYLHNESTWEGDGNYRMSRWGIILNMDVKRRGLLLPTKHGGYFRSLS